MSMVDGMWVPGIGDPSPMGWVTVAAYLGAAAHCAVLARAGRAGVAFWAGCALLLLLLGLNKQLDLQSALTEIGRFFALRHGWYGQRGTVQLAFIGAVALGGLAGLAVALRLAWPLTRGRVLALAGLAFIGAFVLIRASSFHHVDAFLGRSLGGVYWNWILELGGIALAWSGAALEHRRRL